MIKQAIDMTTAPIGAQLRDGRTGRLPRDIAQDYLHLRLPLAGSTVEFLFEAMITIPNRNK